MADMPNRLYELRRQRGWSQQELADRAGCSKMHISGVERGKRDFSLALMRKIATVFGVSTAELLSRDDNPAVLADDERRLVETYRSATPEAQANIQRVTEALVPFLHQSRDAA